MTCEFLRNRFTHEANAQGEEHALERNLFACLNAANQILHALLLHRALLRVFAELIAHGEFDAQQLIGAQVINVGHVAQHALIE